MKQFYLIAVTAAVIVSGCRSANDLYQTKSLTGLGHPSQADVSAAPGLSSQAAESAFAQSDRHRLPDVNGANVQPVAYEQGLNVPQPPGSDPLLTAQPTDVWLSDLSLAGLENTALQNNPTLAQAAARVEAAQGNWVQVGLAPNPVLGYSGQQLGSGGLAEQQGVFVGQEFVTGKKLGLNREVAAWQVQRAERELEAFRLRVLTDVRIGYYGVLIAQRRRDLATDLVRISSQGEQAAQALFKGDEVSEADPLRARVEADTARILLQNSINQHFESWRRLTAVLGLSEVAIQRLEGELKADNLDLSWQETLRQVLSESPEMAAAIADVEAAQWAVERAYAEVVPNLDVQAVIQDDRSTGSTNGILQVTLPIPIWNRNQGGIRQAQAEATAAELAVDRLKLDLQARLATAFQRYESARNQVDRYSLKGGILDNAGRTLDLIRTGYKAEEFGVLDLLSAQRTYFQTNLSYLDSQRELWVSVVEIQGLLLQGSLAK